MTAITKQISETYLLIRPLLTGKIVKTLLIYGILPILFFLSLFVGRYEVPPNHVIQLLAAPLINLLPDQVMHIEPGWTAAEQNIIYLIRLPRVIAAVLVGAGLAIAGAAYQGLLKSTCFTRHSRCILRGRFWCSTCHPPLPRVIHHPGIRVLFRYPCCHSYIPAQSVLSHHTLTHPRPVWNYRGGFFTALISLTKYVADPYEKLPAITFWLMGSLASVRYTDILLIAPPFSVQRWSSS